MTEKLTNIPEKATPDPETATELGEVALGFEELDLSTPEITQALSEAGIYTKTALVRIRQAQPGEQIKTVLGDGTEETVNMAGENEVIITNPGGEEYIISAEKAAGRYEKTDEDGVYKAKGMVRAMQNPTGRPIEIMAPWGEKQFGGADTIIATTYDPSDPENIGADRYIIGRQEFEDTYAPAAEQPAE